jgi:hypothetical protein
MQRVRHHSGNGEQAGGSVGSALGGMITHFWAEAKPIKAAPTRAQTTKNLIVLVWCCGLDAAAKWIGCSWAVVVGL